MQDWEDKISQGNMHCPLCGCCNPADQWFTQRQIEEMQEIAANWAYSCINQKLDEVFSDFAKSTRRNKYIRVTYKRSKPITFINNPIGQSSEWETEIICEKCSTRYSVIGAAYFCPCCGYNSVVNAFNDSLDSINKMLESLIDMREMLTTKYDIDSSETMCRSLLESSIGDMVSAFQKFASCKYEELSGKSSRVNDFQIVDKGSQLFESTVGQKYSDWLSDDELSFMKVMFQKRHLLEHNNGMVDQKYIDNSKDTTYVIGQRIIVKERDAFKLLKILRKLGKALMKLQTGGDSNSNQ